MGKDEKPYLLIINRNGRQHDVEVWKYKSRLRVTHDTGTFDYLARLTDTRIVLLITPDSFVYHKMRWRQMRDVRPEKPPKASMKGTWEFMREHQCWEVSFRLDEWETAFAPAGGDSLVYGELRFPKDRSAYKGSSRDVATRLRVLEDTYKDKLRIYGDTRSEMAKERSRKVFLKRTLQELIEAALLGEDTEVAAERLRTAAHSFMEYSFGAEAVDKYKPSRVDLYDFDIKYSAIGDEKTS